MVEKQTCIHCNGRGVKYAQPYIDLGAHNAGLSCEPPRASKVRMYCVHCYGFGHIYEVKSKTELHLIKGDS